MNIFKKLSLANKIGKLIKDLKKHFDKNSITEEIRKKLENAINALKDLGAAIPEVKEEIEEIVEIIKKHLKK